MLTPELLTSSSGTHTELTEKGQVQGTLMWTSYCECTNHQPHPQQLQEVTLVSLCCHQPFPKNYKATQAAGAPTPGTTASQGGLVNCL